MFNNSFFLMILSALCFAVMGAAVKLSGDLPLTEKVFFRNFVIFLVIFLSQLGKDYKKFLGQKGNHLFLVLRSLFGLAGVFLYFYSIDHLLLADAAILNKLSPFFVALLAPFLLKERRTKWQPFFLVLAFAGTLFVIKPQFSMSVVPALSGVIGALFAGLAYTCVSYLGRREDSLVIIFWFCCISLIVIFPFFIWQFKMPTWQQAIFLCLTGLAGAGGQYFLTLSYASGKATDVSVYSYTMVIFSGILGFFIWHEVPDWLSIVGMALIIVASVGLYESKKQVT